MRGRGSPGFRATTLVPVDAAQIRWARRHRPGDFAVMRPSPPLVFAPESFDVVYAISIFTHLDEREQWGSWSHAFLFQGQPLVGIRLKVATHVRKLPVDIVQLRFHLGGQGRACYQKDEAQKDEQLDSSGGHGRRLA
jgi:hypothetical protein